MSSARPTDTSAGPSSTRRRAAGLSSAALALLLQGTAFAGVGRTPGVFQVSPTGAATYTIPLWTPPGIGQLQLQLALVYNSAAGDGLLGQGWSLAAGSYIRRCMRTLAQNGSAGPITLTSGTGGDRYCLDGKRLRLDSGTYGFDGAVYRTEIDTFANIKQSGATVSSASPDWFEVRTKDGLVYEYGNTTDSKFYANGDPNKPITTWALSKIADRSGNSIKFAYTIDQANSPGAYRLSTIDYPYTVTGGGTAPYQVKLNYESRGANDSVLSDYFAGYAVQEKNRLKDVSVLYNGGTQLLRKYKLSYEPGPATGRDRIYQIEECGTSSDCLSATKISYEQGATDWSTTESSTNQTINLLGNAFALDLDGNGRIDLIYPTGAYFYVMWGTGTDFGSPTNTWIESGNYTNALPLDYFGDGKQGLLLPNGANWRYIYWNGSSFVAKDNLSEGNGTVALPSDGAQNTWIVDVNGDGRQDLVYSRDLGQWSLSQITAKLNGPAGFSNTESQIWEPSGIDLHDACETISASSANPRVFGSTSNRNRAQIHFADFNGDGKPDIFLQVKRLSSGTCTVDGPTGVVTWHNLWRVLVSHAGTGFDDGSTFSPAAVPSDLLIGDFNGDGLADVIGADSTASQWKIAYGRGSGALSFANTNVPVGDTSKVLFVDWDGDSRTDILYYSGSTYYVARSTATGFAAGAALSTIGSGTTSPIIADVNADGLPDIVYANANNNVKYRLRNGSTPDLLTSVSNGYRNGAGAIGYLNSASPAYVSIASAAATNGSTPIYTSATGALFPEREFPGPMIVVSSVTLSDGIGGTYTQTYKYSGARVHVQGRGFEGFATRKMIDSRDNFVHFEQYHQTFPKTGIPQQVELRRSDDSTVIQKNVNTVEAIPGGSGADTRQFPYIQKSVTETRENLASPNNALIATTTTEIFDMDSTSGTPKDTKVTLVDQYNAADNDDYTKTYITETVTGSASYPLTNDTTSWCIGRPSRQTVTRTVPGLGAQTRTVAYTMDTPVSSCRVRVETIEPDDAALKVTTTTDYHSCGGVSQVSVVGSEPNGSGGWQDMPPRVTTKAYMSNGGLTCQFPDSTTNADGQTKYEYYWDTGLLKKVTDPNLIETKSLTYDNYGRLSKETHPDGTATRYTWTPCSPCTVTTGLAAYVDVDQLDTSGNVFRNDRTYVDSLERPRVVAKEGLAAGSFAYSETTYDNRGRIDKQYAPSDFQIRSEGDRQTNWDDLGRMIGETYHPKPGGSFGTVVTYQGLKAEVTDGRSNVWTRWFDVEGRLHKLIDPAAVSGGSRGVTSYLYDQFGNLTTVNDAATPISNTTSWTYNRRGFVTDTNDPDRGHWTYVTNSLGEVRSQTDAKNQIMQMTYDLMGRLITRVDPNATNAPGGTSQWHYGTSAALKNIGRLDWVSHAATYYLKTYDYDLYGRPSQTRTIMPDTGDYTINYSYNLTTGLPETLTYPYSIGSRLKVKYEYGRGIVNKVSDYTNDTGGTVFWQANSTDPLGNTTDETLGTNPAVRVVSAYDLLRGFVTDRKAGTDGGPTNRQNLHYEWDAVGNLSSRKAVGSDAQHPDATENFVYDNMNRLLSSSVSWFGNTTLTYVGAKDEIGRFTTLYGGAITYAYNSGHAHAPSGITEQSSCPVTHGYGYDLNGNMTNRDGKTIQWYSYNMPSLINYFASTTPSTYASSQFFYTPDRQRWKQIAYVNGVNETTTYVEGLMEIVQRGGVTSYRHYIPVGPSVMVVHTRNTGGNATYYAVKDHLGSTSALLDSSGALMASLTFDEYGYRTGINWQGAPSAADLTTIDQTTRHGFTGHEHLDNFQLINMNGRIFDPWMNLFISADPGVDGIGDSQGFNRYTYLKNRPLSGTDPSGFASTPWRPRNLEGGLWSFACDGGCRTVYDSGSSSNSSLDASVETSYDEETNTFTTTLVITGVTAANGGPGGMWAYSPSYSCAGDASEICTAVQKSWVPFSEGWGSIPADTGGRYFRSGEGGSDRTGKSDSRSQQNQQQQKDQQQNHQCSSAASTSRANNPNVGRNMVNTGALVGAGGTIVGAFFFANAVGFPEVEVAEGMVGILEIVDALHAVGLGGLLGAGLGFTAGEGVGLALTDPTCP